MKEHTSQKILVFGGTIEGRQVSDYLSSGNVCHTLCVATEYGEDVLEQKPCLTIHRGRMDMEEMCAFLQNGSFGAVVDATHPYAVEVSENIRQACMQENLPYLRYLRDCTHVEQAGHVYVNSAAEAAAYLEQKKGKIFLTTGSKELHVFTERISDRSRLFARVLPSPEVVASCRALGLEGKQICGMQGPFSEDMNVAMLRQTGADFLVTKDTGTSGGCPEKLQAAARLGICTVIIRRPEEAGLDWEQLKAELEKLTGYCAGGQERLTEHCAGGQERLTGYCTGGKKEKCDGSSERQTGGSEEKRDRAEKQDGRRLYCVGIGMGTYSTLTREAETVIREGDILFGAKRILESVRKMFGWDENSSHPVMVVQYSGEKIAEYLREHPEYKNAVMLMSGDVGFYSGAREIGRSFPGEQVEYICGISSVVYFASRIPTSWQDAKLLSAHGKRISVLNYVNRYPKIILLVSGREDVQNICGTLWEAAMDQVKVTVGTNLSYPEETVTVGKPSDFLSCDTTGLHILMLENPLADHVITPGIPDDAFVRGKVPMTKEEVRILSVSKMRLTEDAVVYDVGAGTGSVSVEIGRLATAGIVYAIEKNPEGIALIRENSRKMKLSNVVPIEGQAPEILEGLPSPTHAFIGGSSGNMREIIEVLLEKNPDVRITINTVSLESIGEVMAVIKALDVKNADIVQMSAARSRTLGRYHLMNGLNPVYVISFGGKTGRNDGEF